MTVEATSPSSLVLSGGIVSPDHLTPDAMMIYLQTRLNAVDDQINEIMDKQKKSEAARKALQACQNENANVGEEGGEVNVDVYVTSLNQIQAEAGAEAAQKLFDNLPAGVRDKIVVGDGSFSPAEQGEMIPVSKDEMASFKTWTDNSIKDVESGAELEMIKLQSLMSARSTAISLATNITSAMGKSTEAIAGNIGR